MKHSLGCPNQYQYICIILLMSVLQEKMYWQALRGALHRVFKLS